jgi:competence protein ComEC
LLHGAAALAVVWIHLGPPPASVTGPWEAAVLDVGQGQSVLMRGAGGAVLVDAGGSADIRRDPGERVVLPVLASLGVRRLEALILTHEHVDHVGGAFAVLHELEVAELWLGPGSSRRPVLADLAARARARGTAIVLAEAGKHADLAGFPVRVLAPRRTGLERFNANDRSLVVLAGAEPHRLVIPGDLEEAGEGEWLATQPGPVEALVLSHHGSRRGSDPRLLRRLRPRWAVASAGLHNAFGHPHSEVLARLEDLGIPLARTDRQGLIRLRPLATGWAVEGSRCGVTRSGSGPG